MKKFAITFIWIVGTSLTLFSRSFLIHMRQPCSRKSSSSVRFMSSDPTRSIKIIKQPTMDTLQKLGVQSWPTWSCAKSKFPWSYDETETCYVIKGSAIITPKGTHADQPPVTIQVGDLCTFPEGLSCTWEVTEDIQKHYTFN